MQWLIDARIEYETSDLTLKEIASKYNKSHSLLQKYSAQQNWDKKAKKVNKKVEEIIEERASRIADDYVDKINYGFELGMEEALKILNDSRANPKDKLTAWDKFIDIKGLKKQTVDNNNKTEFINHIMLDD